MIAVAFEAAFSIIAGGLILAVLYGPWQTVCTDYFRQPLFEQRDALFELARSKAIPFDDAAYRRTRSVIEAYIRFAHEVSFARAIAHRRLGPDLRLPASPWPELGQYWDEESRKAHQQIVNSVNRALVSLLIAKSPALWVALLLSTFLVLALGAIVGLRRVFRGPYNALVGQLGSEALLSSGSFEAVRSATWSVGASSGA